MLTALDAPADTLDEGERSFVSKIRQHGWFRTGVLGDGEGPGFSFTTGFWVNAAHPEVIIFSTKEEIAHDVFWDLYRDVKSGKNLPIGKRTDAVFANLPAYAFRVAKKHFRDFLGWSRSSTVGMISPVCRSFGQIGRGDFRGSQSSTLSSERTSRTLPNEVG
jgi:hypothetical protein